MKVSVVALPTKVSVEVGKVKVPVLTIEEKFGVVKTGEIVIATFPEPDTVYSPKAPELLYKTLVFVPPEILEDPITKPAAPKIAFKASGESDKINLEPDW